MNNPKSFTKATYFVAVSAVLLLFLLISRNVGAPAKSLTGTDDPQITITEFFNAVHDRDFETADKLLGNCTLVNTDMKQQSEVSQKLFDALCSSISVSLVGDCRIDGLNASQNVRVTFFDISSSAPQLNTIVKEQIDIMLAEVDVASELYDENNEYRQDVVMSVFDKAVAIMLENADDYYITKEFTIELFHDESGWNIKPSDELLACMTGGMN